MAGAMHNTAWDSILGKVSARGESRLTLGWLFGILNGVLETIGGDTDEIDKSDGNSPSSEVLRSGLPRSMKGTGT